MEKQQPKKEINSYQHFLAANTIRTCLTAIKLSFCEVMLLLRNEHTRLVEGVPNATHRLLEMFFFPEPCRLIRTIFCCQAPTSLLCFQGKTLFYAPSILRLVHFDGFSDWEIFILFSYYVRQTSTRKCHKTYIINIYLDNVLKLWSFRFVFLQYEHFESRTSAVDILRHNILYNVLYINI